jgi:hypothetical protein
MWDKIARLKVVFFDAIHGEGLAIFPQCTRQLLAHRVISLRYNDLSVFGAKRPRVSHPPEHAVLRPRRGKTLHDARALPADLSADDFCRPASYAGLKSVLIWRPGRDRPRVDIAQPFLL